MWLLLGLIREVTNVQLTPFFYARGGAPDERGWTWEKVGGFGHTLVRYINRCQPAACQPKFSITLSL